MKIFIVVFILIVLLIIQIIANYISGKRYIDIFDKDSLKKLSIYNYKSFEIKRKRRPYARTAFFPYTECSLEYEFPTPWSIIPANDIIEVYGIENNKKYLIYKIEWSKNGIKEIINIVNELNQNINK